jgi:ribosomal protein L16/L10AE
LFNDAGRIGKGKGPIKQPVTETKVKFDRLLFAVQENQQDKLLAIKHAAIDRAQNFANSIHI